MRTRPLAAVCLTAASLASTALFTGTASAHPGPGAEFPGAETSGPAASGDARGNLLGVEAVASNDVWAVGTRPGHPWRVIVKHWDGTAWTASAAPALGLGGDEALYDVNSASSKDVWAVGRAFLRNNASPRSMIEHWDGSRWSVVSAPQRQVSNQLYAVVAINRRDAWAVGQETVRRAFQPLVDHWDGRSWTAVDTPSMPGCGLYAVSASGPDDVWAVGSDFNEDKVLVEHWDGSSWTVSNNSPGPYQYVELDAVAAFTPTDVHAIGYSSGAHAAETFDDVWNGTRWTQEQTGLNSGDGLSAASATSPDDIWAVGDSAAHSTDSERLRLTGTGRHGGPPRLPRLSRSTPTSTPLACLRQTTAGRSASTARADICTASSSTGTGAGGSTSPPEP